MAEKPDNAEPRRRWYQFGLRTLLIGVALLGVPCAYVAHEYRIVAARKAWMETHFTAPYGQVAWRGSSQRLVPSAPSESLPIFRRWLGDEAVRWTEAEPDELDRAKELFPEADWTHPMPLILFDPIPR